MVIRSSSLPQRLVQVAGFCIFLVLGVFKTCAQPTWTLRNSPTSGGDLLWSVTDGNGGMVAVGNNGKILRSDDGKEWTTSASGTAAWLVSVTYGAGRYIAVGDNGTVLSSTDSVTWSRISQTVTTARLNNVVYAQNHFVAVGEGGTVVVSETGDTWSATSSGVTGWLHGLAYGGGYWMATGQAGIIIFSKDGLTWTRGSGPAFQNLEAVAFVAFSNMSMPPYRVLVSSFVVVGQDGVALICEVNERSEISGTPTTLLNVSATYTRTSVRLGSIAVYNNVFIATGDNGTVITAKSIYGPWTKLNLGTSKLLNAAGFGRSSLFLAGEGDVIYQSEPIFPSRLGNVSTRGLVGVGANVMIAGTVIDGANPKTLLVRAVGPALTSYGIVGAVPDPVLTVYDAQGGRVASNAGWETGPYPSYAESAAKSFGAFDLPPNSNDSALIVRLNPGAYTFMVSSAGGTGGVGLVEAYDLDLFVSSASRLINISTRGVVGTDERIMIAGFVIQGPSSRTLLIRGVGPTLGSNYGVTGTLDDPVIKVIQGDGTVLATNDNWSEKTVVFGTEVTGDQIRAVTAQVGAFPLTEASKDAAILITLAPGNYTVHVTGKNNTAGVALVEAYEVRPTN